MAILWPSTLPERPEKSDFSSQKQDGRLRTQMDAGPVKMRRRFTAVVETLTCSFFMDTDQVDIFNTFFDDTLYGGTLTYQWTHPISGTTRNFRIVDIPTIRNIGGTYWRVSFKAEALPGSV